MNKALRACVRLYFQEDVRGIHAISQTDGEIMSELMSALKKMPDTELYNIFSQYKANKDEKVLSALLEWNTQNSASASITDEEGKPKRAIFRLGNVLMDTREINLVRIGSRVDAVNDREVYFIIINPTDSGRVSNATYTNVIVEFDTKAQRDYHISRMQQHQEYFDKCIFL